MGRLSVLRLSMAWVALVMLLAAAYAAPVGTPKEEPAPPAPQDTQPSPPDPASEDLPDIHLAADVVDYDEYDDEDDQYYQEQEQEQQEQEQEQQEQQEQQAQALGNAKADQAPVRAEPKPKKLWPSVEEMRLLRVKEFDKEYERYEEETADQLVKDPNMAKSVLEALRANKDDSVAEKAVEAQVAQKLQRGFRSRLDEQPRLAGQAQAIFLGMLNTCLSSTGTGLIRCAISQKRQVIERMRRAAKRADNTEPERPDQAKFGDKGEGSHNEALVRNVVEKRVRLMGQLDERSRQAFVEHMMQRELEFRERMKATTNAADRRRLNEEHQKAWADLKKRRDFQPGHRDQLQEVWDNIDGMKGQKFTPKVEALVNAEATRLHTIEDFVDEQAVAYEAVRMRQAFMADVDTNKDDMISLQEFMLFAASNSFADSKNWTAIVPEFDDASLEKFRERVEALKEDRDGGAVPQGVAETADLVQARLAKERSDGFKRLQKMQADHQERIKTRRAQKMAHLARKKRAAQEPPAE
ncbi:uncharacterized protein MONBRDRAFT_33891 [Monosiga brevicollis MX1]|uniref:EF-hand domain-containing protein n=1 Tax=Monosiga brevicollis TaxID=81824 RepID=A9V878_MONBE|nr:uncharacterized protein MONBRDRAFT_33891 [Monosiga brevicollis MX1]EDQ86291.1 predicted protein [Monosiga brevicollis MX1]|eukprot:XP_001748961.1 hypothetical protein [Monosiga brevicollis MX1]